MGSSRSRRNQRGETRSLTGGLPAKRDAMDKFPNLKEACTHEKPFSVTSLTAVSNGSGVPSGSAFSTIQLPQTLRPEAKVSPAREW